MIPIWHSLYDNSFGIQDFYLHIAITDAIWAKTKLINPLVTACINNWDFVYERVLGETLSVVNS